MSVNGRMKKHSVVHLGAKTLLTKKKVKSQAWHSRGAKARTSSSGVHKQKEGQLK